MKNTVRKFKKIALISMGGLLLVTVALVLLAYLFEDKIKSMAINQLNKNLVAPVSVQDVELSFLRHFPNATLQFYNIKARESFNGSNRDLAEISYMSLFFSPLDLINGKYTLKRILIKDAKINVRINEKGEPNYEIWKASEKNEAAKFEVDLREIDMLRVNLEYEDMQGGQYFTSYIKEGTFAG
nr:AsmA family protein [Bacteroidota bacterium]